MPREPPIRRKMCRCNGKTCPGSAGQSHLLSFQSASPHWQAICDGVAGTNPIHMLLRLQNGVAAMTGMVREQERTANNLANAGTIGYKRDRAFVELLGQRIDAEGGTQSTRQTHAYVDFAEGNLEKTGNQFDLAIDGEGFFVLTDQETDESRYTRAGRMSLDTDGMLVSASGRQVGGEAGPIQIPLDATTVEIKGDGSIRADGQLVGRVRVVSFEDPTLLTRISGTEFESDAAEAIEAPGRVRQGFVEHSNVNPLQAMTGMIEHLRLFEMQQRLLRSTDENLSQSIRSLGRF
jgi:flagellar basal-body rod protein FlgF